jgi:hypothetical protein
MNNKSSGIVFLCFFSCLAGCNMAEKEKYFTGTIDYSYSYSSDSLTKTRPVKGIFRYDETDYQSTFIGPDTVIYYYSGKTNRCISRTESSGRLICEDYSVVTDSVLSASLYDTDEKVLGYSCKILELEKRNSWVKYYVSRDLKIAPGTYRLHKSYNWDIYGEKAEGGLILKLEHRFKSFTMSGTATSIQIVKDTFSALEMPDKDFDEFCLPEIR